MNININDSVSVTLTPSGAEIWNAKEEDTFERFKHMEWFVPKYKQSGDVLKEQLWHLFQVFGSSIHLGGDVPFENCLITFGDE